MSEKENLENDGDLENDGLDIDNLDEEMLSEEISDEIVIEKDKTEETDFEIMFKNTANKHKQEGTHALKRDTIFMGKENDEEEGLESSTDFFDNTYNIEQGSTYEYESHYNDDYNYKKNLIKDIYEILEEKTEIDFLANRRKPNKKTFNEYYDMCVEDLITKYNKSEIFVELSYYFTDSIFNMFKLLNKKNASGIILELREKGYLNSIGNINFI